jgi:hypothetical protein
MPSLDQILDVLDRHHQRATYGAVGDLLSRPARSVMLGRPRDARHSWVVRKADGAPTGYGPSEQHPALRSRPEVLASGQELRAWLSRHGA